MRSFFSFGRQKTITAWLKVHGKLALKLVLDFIWLWNWFRERFIFLVGTQRGNRLERAVKADRWPLVLVHVLLEHKHLINCLIVE